MIYSKHFLLSFPFESQGPVLFFVFVFWLTLVGHVPSSSPKRDNYYWPGERISKIISCVVSDGNNYQGTDSVLGLEEISSPEPLL